MSLKAIISTMLILPYLAAHGLAATYTVTNTNDSGLGSLRSAVAMATSTPAADVIIFNIPGCPNGVCTITLTTGELRIDSGGSLTIFNSSGPQSLIVSGNGISRIFHIYFKSSSSISIEGITITEGNANYGGGILAVGSWLRIKNSVITKCKAGYGGGIYSSSWTMEVDNSEISENTAIGDGGGIRTHGDVGIWIGNSTIADNIAPHGGGLTIFPDYGSEAVFVNSTISGNKAVDNEGNEGLGGAFALAGGGKYGYIFISLLNVTVSQNSAAVGGAFAGGGNTFINLRNSIIAENIASSAYPDIDPRYITVANLGNNVIGQPALLSPLANNGGPTRTHALLAGSPAINAGNDCVLTENGCGDGNPALVYDQRGFGRVGSVDIGAFEFNSSSTHLLSGRVTTSLQRGIARAVVTLDDGAGNLSYATTNPFGYFRFFNLPTGTYTVSVRSKRYGFTPRTISVISSVTDLDFVAEGATTRNERNGDDQKEVMK